MFKKKIGLLFCTTFVVLNLGVIKTVSANEPEIGKVNDKKLTLKSFAPNNYIGQPIFKEYGEEKIRDKEVIGWMWGWEEHTYPTKAIAMYQVAVVECPYIHNSVGYLHEGSIYTSSTTTINTTSVTESSSSIVTSTAKIAGEVGFKYGDIKTKGSFSAEVSNQISSCISVDCSKTNEQHCSVQTPIKVSGYYFDDFRATYKLYQVQEFEIINDKVKDHEQHSGIWATDVYYRVEKQYKCTSIAYTLEYISDCGRTLAKYKQQDDGTFIYDGPRENSSILYM